MSDEPYRVAPPKPPDPYRGPWARMRRFRLVSVFGGALTLSCFVATSLSASLVWMPLGILAFLVLWLPAFFGVDSPCPHCNGRFFGDVPARGSLATTLWKFFVFGKCQRCRIPIGTPKDAVGEWAPQPSGAQSSSRPTSG